MVTSTRSASGKTPRKTEHPGYVETPARGTRRSRKSTALYDGLESSSPDRDGDTVSRRRKTRDSGGESTSDVRKSNGEAKTPGRPRKSATARKGIDSKSTKAADWDKKPVYEFGGTLGVSAMMVGFPLLMWYMWIGATYHEGKLPLPEEGQSASEFVTYLWHRVYEGAFPHLGAWIMYWTFFVFEATCYLFMPGVYAKGKPLPHLHDLALDYYCSGLFSFYSTIVLAAGLHFSGLFPLYTLIDEFGPLMSVAIISGFGISIVAYISALYRNAQHRMTGHHIYDFFMGAELNPRMFQWLDFKMFFEVRLPWFILFLVTAGACARQYEQWGFISGELAFLLMAHFLYANACAKAEQLIPPTWDMYYEKWGFMLIFWNCAGVPLTYCHATIYMSNFAPSTYRWPRPFLAFLYVSYLFAYWVWDTCGSQKNGFRAAQRGHDAVSRKTFPQLPFRSVGDNPRTIPVDPAVGDDLLADGWYRYARKIHYTCDMYFALCWALVCGFGSPFPWFYPVFFALMIAHRASRDLARCREKYGKSWEEYEKKVPYLFIPYVY